MTLVWIPGYEGLYKISDSGDVWSFVKEPKKMRPTANGRINLTKDGCQTGHNVQILASSAFRSTKTVEPEPEILEDEEMWLDVPEFDEIAGEMLWVSDHGRLKLEDETITRGEPCGEYRTFRGAYVHQIIYMTMYGTWPHPNRRVHDALTPTDEDGCLFNFWYCIIDENKTCAK